MNQAIIDASGSKGLTAKLAGAMAQLRAVIFQTLMCLMCLGGSDKTFARTQRGLQTTTRVHAVSPSVLNRTYCFPCAILHAQVAGLPINMNDAASLPLAGDETVTLT